MTTRMSLSRNFLISISVLNKSVEPLQKQDEWQRRTSAAPHPKEESNEEEQQEHSSLNFTGYFPVSVIVLATSSFFSLYF